MKLIKEGIRVPYPLVPKREYSFPFPFTCYHCNCQFDAERPEDIVGEAQVHGTHWFIHANCMTCGALIESSLPLTKEDEAVLREYAKSIGLM